MSKLKEISKQAIFFESDTTRSSSIRQINNQSLLESSLDLSSHKKQYLQWHNFFGPCELPKFNLCINAFEDFVKKQPNAIAIEHLSQKVTYQQLNKKADKIAYYLTKQKIKAQDRVGIFTKRGINFVASILACLKLNVIYVPQDIEISPREILSFVDQDSDLKFILSEEQYLHKLEFTDQSKIVLLQNVIQYFDQHPIQTDNLSAYNQLNLNHNQYNLYHNQYSLNDCCFILFTSGTTGKPKGVMVSHGNLSNILLTSQGSLQIQPGDKVAQLLNIACDMAAWEILGCLSNGGQLIIRGSDFQQCINKATHIIATPSILNRLEPDSCHYLKVVAVAGEPCSFELANKWSAYCKFYNSCGPTETTIVNSMHLFKGEVQMSIGKPTANNSIYVLDEQLQPCAIGQTGEMWAGGNGVTLGYLNQEDLTKQRYILDPFKDDGSVMYRTMDLGQWNENGELIHCGRVDDQVKIKGFRVQLDGVSKVIEQISQCKKVVSLKLDNQQIVSFMIGHIQDSFKQDFLMDQSNKVSEALFNLLNQSLPYYAIPTFLFSIEDLPMTDRGKVDKSFLLNLAKNWIENSNKQEELS